MSDRLARLFEERPEFRARASELEWEVLLSYLFPDVAERDGSFFKADSVDETNQSWFSGEYSKQQIEYVLNHLHLWDVIEYSDVDAERAVALRDLVAEVWRWWLPQASSAKLLVWTAEDGDEYGPTVGFGVNVS